MASNEEQKDETRCVSTIQEDDCGVGYTLVALWNDSPSPNLAFPVIPTNPGLSTTKWFVAGQIPRHQQLSLWQHMYIFWVSSLGHVPVGTQAEPQNSLKAPQ